jgi:cytochrome P450
VTVVQEYFGFRAPTPDMLRWSFITQDSFFHNVPYLRGVRGFAVRVLGLAGPTLQAQQEEALLVHERGAVAGEEMRDFLDAYIAGHRAEILAEDTVLSRMLRVNDTLAHPKEMARIRANVMGGLIGAVETSNAAIVQSLHQLLRRPEALARARAAAAKIGPDDAIERSELAGYVWEALRFHPINPFVVRYATADAVLGDGATSAQVKKGQRVLTATFSAMHDPRTVEAPDEFRPVRPPRDREMELGYGMHRCLGDRIAEVMVPEVLRQLVLLPDLEWVAPVPALPYDEGIDMGPRRAFPERYVVRYAAPHAISAARAGARPR